MAENGSGPLNLSFPATSHPSESPDSPRAKSGMPGQTLAILGYFLAKMAENGPEL